MRRHAGYLFIFLAASCWGLTGPVGRFAMDQGVAPLEVAFWRAAGGAFFFLAYAARRGSLAVHSKKDFLVFMIFGACSLGAFFACYQFAIQTGGAALAAVLLYTAPAWVALFSRIFFKEAMSLNKLTAIALSLAGVALISFSGPGPDTAAVNSSVTGHGLAAAGIIFGLLSGLLYSTHYVFSTMYLGRYSTYTMYGYAMLSGMIVLLPFIRFADKTPFQWGVLLFLGLVCTSMAYWAYCEGIRRLEATRAAVLATLEPVVATAAAWGIWGENFAPVGWLGAAMVIGAVLVLVLSSPINTKKTAAGTRPPKS